MFFGCAIAPSFSGIVHGGDGRDDGLRHRARAQGLLSKLVADIPAELRGTAFGAFNLVTGGALLLASIIAGALWSAFGPSTTFMAGAAFAALAALLLAATDRRLEPNGPSSGGSPSDDLSSARRRPGGDRRKR
jgi:MFS family permease